MTQAKGTILSSKKDFRIMSDVKCDECGQMLKFNLIRKKPYAKVCFKCYKESK